MQMILCVWRIRVVLQVALERRTACGAFPRPRPRHQLQRELFERLRAQWRKCQNAP